jgi:hypothetical protein
VKAGVVVAALIAALAIACGAAMKQSTPAPQAMSARPGDLHAQIDELDRDITSRMGSASVPAPTAAEVEAVRPVTMDAAAGVCAPPPTPSASCDDVCRLGDAICDDARRICDLAEQLPGDAWAAGKCDGGKASCARAKQRCCDCR